MNLSHHFYQYFGKAYFLHVYNERGSVYSATISKTDHWSGTFTISNSHIFKSGLIKVVLFHTYSSEFLFKCESYFIFIGLLISFSSIIEDQVFLEINYYGEQISRHNLV